MAEAHRDLIEKQGLNETHFDLVAGHLVGTLVELGVTEGMIEEVKSIVVPLRSIFERAKPPPSLFIRLGGAPSVDAAVDLFYTKVLSDAALIPFFEGHDMARLKNHQRR